MKQSLHRLLDFRTMTLAIAVALCGITGCAAPSPTMAVSTPTSAPLPQPTSTSAPTLTPRPTSTVEGIPYDADPNVLLVQAQTIYPPRPPEFQCYAFSDLRVWGDGRVVRVMTKGDHREIAVGRLSANRVGELLAFLKEQGALSPWPREMPNPAGSGFSFKVQLKAGPVENWSNSAPAFFPKLLDFFNPEVQPLIPQQAFLIAIVGWATPDQVREWPASFNISLMKAMDEGLWISGDALNFLWDDANNTLSQHVFRENGKMYAVALEIAGVGPKEPPENCWADWNKRLPRVEQITLDQARQIPGFHLLEPGFLPAGFHLKHVSHTTTVSTFVDPTNPLLPATTRYFDSVGLEYSGPPPTGRAGNQGFLSIGERFFPDMPLPPGFPPLPATPDLHPETVIVRNATALVTPNYYPPDWVTPEPDGHEHFSLEWHERDYYFMVTGSSSLEELTQIANSLK